jgi:hypothetical protein
MVSDEGHDVRLIIDDEHEFTARRALFHVPKLRRGARAGQRGPVSRFRDTGYATWLYGCAIM